MTFTEIAQITEGEILESLDPNDKILTLITDSRKPFVPKGALFFAIPGVRHDGHHYVHELFKKGARNFVVTDKVCLPGANVLKVDNVIKALQVIARKHRENYTLPVVGITGSNGKTIVKEWLSSCLAPHEKIVKSPHSFNSQVGVPLSVWNISPLHSLGIFEAGISTTGEMGLLAEIIQPTIGIFTNLGTAHDEGFSSLEEKFNEKAKLFANVDRVIHKEGHPFIQFGEKSFMWGTSHVADVQIKNVQSSSGRRTLTLEYQSTVFSLTLPFDDDVSVENAMHCITFMLFNENQIEDIQQSVQGLRPISMRLALKKTVNNSYLIDDTYNNDLVGLQQAIAFLSLQNQRDRKVVILSDILQTGLEQAILYKKIADMIETASVDYFIGVGESISSWKSLFKPTSSFFTSTSAFLNSLDKLDLSNALLLVKGSRSFSFEKVVQALEEKVHGTVLEINLDALTNNLNFYRSKIRGEARIMVMVKAFAYGSGSFEVANLLQFHRVDYLGVAYADEGVQLRKNGIYLPIMVMNANEESFESLTKYDLEPVIYDLLLLQKYLDYVGDNSSKIHLELDTGMKRLGFGSEELPTLIQALQANRHIVVQSIFSHLAAADEEEHLQFSKEQASVFQKLSQNLMDALNATPLLHLVNSPGILRYPEYHFDMVRLGIGLYGLEANNREQEGLQSISILKTVISQIREVNAGESIGYGRRGRAKKKMRIATIAIGYADGFNRSFSNGVGEVWVRGKRASVVGNVCMDMTMIDITDSSARVGDEVEIFGEHITISELAD